MKQYFLFLALLALLFSQAPVASEQQGQIIDSKFNYQLYDGQPYIFSIGFIENTSEYPLDDMTVSVQYYDNNGELIDAAFENFYSLSIPPNDKVAFKVQSFAARESEFYASHEVRIVSSHQDIPCNQSVDRNNNKSTYDLIKKLLINWFPLLLLIIVWIVLARKYSGKGSNQQRLVDLMEKQVKFDEERNKEISNIANSLRNKKSNDK